MGQDMNAISRTMFELLCDDEPDILNAISTISPDNNGIAFTIIFSHFVFLLHTCFAESGVRLLIEFDRNVTSTCERLASYLI